MINKSMMPIFNKISDLFKSKVYVESGPLEQQDTKIKCIQQIYKDDIPVCSNDQKNTLQNQKEESSNLTNKQESVEYEKEKEKEKEKETSDLSKFTNRLIVNNNLSHLSSSVSDLKTEFNV